MEVRKRDLCVILIPLLLLDIVSSSVKDFDDSTVHSKIIFYNDKQGMKPANFELDKTYTESENYAHPLSYLNTQNDEDDDEAEDLDYYYDNKENFSKEESDSSNDHNLTDLINFTKEVTAPMFLLEPENTYVVKSMPATLKCRVTNALEIYFRCNGVKYRVLNFEFVDPQTGTRVLEGEYNVTKAEVQEYFGNDKYQCSCYAWTNEGHINSQPATVEIAYLRKHFAVSPESQLIKISNPVIFRCEPPSGAPFPQTYWLKNGAPLVLNDNVELTKETYLYIRSATLMDMANYTCVAENLAGRRISSPAVLTIFVNGGWSQWSSWGECWCPDRTTGEQRSQGGRRRVRSCTSPRPLNGGQPCLGPSVQKTQDCLDCDLDVYIDTLDELSETSNDLGEHWSQWSQWSRCDSDCLKSRRRNCLIDAGCTGVEHQVEQCKFCIRTSGRHFVANGSPYWPLLISISLILAFLIFTVITVLGIKYMKINVSQKSTCGTTSRSNVIKTPLTNQPDLTLHEFYDPKEPKTAQKYNGNSACIRDEHLYEDPLSAYDCLENRLEKKSIRSYFLKDDGDFRGGLHYV